MTHFHTRTALTAEQVTNGEEKAKGQDAVIYEMFVAMPDRTFDQYDASRYYTDHTKKEILPTSARRALTNLAQEKINNDGSRIVGRIKEVGKRLGKYGVNITSYKLRVMENGQEELF